MSLQARSCPYAKNILLAHHFGKKKNVMLALKNIITDMGRIPLFSKYRNKTRHRKAISGIKINIIFLQKNTL
jgi:hypothetical protein